MPTIRSQVTTGTRRPAMQVRHAITPPPPLRSGRRRNELELAIETHAVAIANYFRTHCERSPRRERAIAELARTRALFRALYDDLPTPKETP